MVCGLTYETCVDDQQWTDARARLLRELLGTMQIIKVFTYEIPFLKRKSFRLTVYQNRGSSVGLKSIRRKEMIAIRKILIIRAANQAMAFSIPTLAAVLSFVTYGSTQETLDPVGVDFCPHSAHASRR